MWGAGGLRILRRPVAAVFQRLSARIDGEGAVEGHVTLVVVVLLHVSQSLAGGGVHVGECMGAGVS